MCERHIANKRTFSWRQDPSRIKITSNDRSQRARAHLEYPLTLFDNAYPIPFQDPTNFEIERSVIDSFETRRDT